MTPITDPLDTSFDALAVNDLIVTVNQIAEKAENHVAFQAKEKLPEYVTPPEKLREFAVGLGHARDAAAGGDRDRIAEKKALMAAVKQALILNASHLVLLSLHRNDPSILLNAGYQLKQKSGTKGMPNLVDLVPEVSVKHGPVPGCIQVTAKRVRQTATIELQMTDQDPHVETSWGGQGMYNRSRIEIRGLAPASIIYVRARYHEDGATGRWSSVASLIVL